MHAGIPLHCLSCIKLTHILQRQAASEPGKACTACCDHRHLAAAPTPGVMYEAMYGRGRAHAVSGGQQLNSPAGTLPPAAPRALAGSKRVNRSPTNHQAPGAPANRIASTHRAGNAAQGNGRGPLYACLSQNVLAMAAAQQPSAAQQAVRRCMVELLRRAALTALPGFRLQVSGWIHSG